MTLNSKKYAATYLPLYLGGVVFMLAGAASLSQHLTVLAIASFALFALLFISAIVVNVHYVRQAKAEFDRIMRAGKARQDQRRYE